MDFQVCQPQKPRVLCHLKVAFPASFLTFECHPSAWLLNVQGVDIPHANREVSVSSLNKFNCCQQKNFPQETSLIYSSLHLKLIDLSVSNPDLWYPWDSTGQSKQQKICEKFFFGFQTCVHCFRQNKISQKGIRRNGLTPPYSWCSQVLARLCNVQMCDWSQY